MPTYLVLQWGRGGIRGLEAEVTGDGVRVRATLEHAWPDELAGSTDPESVGRWLKARVQTPGTGERRLIVLLSREDIVMRLLALPDASDETLPELVRYQTGARSSVPLDQLACDYLPLAAAAPGGGRWVQTATVPARVLQHIGACAKAAELELSSVGVTIVAIGEAIARAQLARQLPTDQKGLIVHVQGDQLEVALRRGADLLFSHVSRAADDKAVLVEVRRALLAHEGVAGDDELAGVWFMAPPDRAGQLGIELAARLNCPVHTFDVARDVPRGVLGADLASDAEPSVAALGALLALGQATVPAIDFLHPRRQVARPNRTRLVAAAAVALVVLALLATWVGSRRYLNSLDERLAEKELVVQEQDESLQQAEPTRQAARFLASWEGRRVDWLEQMQRIGAQLPGTERIYFDRWRFDLADGPMLGTTEATGLARDRQDAQRLEQRLVERTGFRIRPNATGTAGSDLEYPVLFQLDAELVSQPRRSTRSESE